MSRVKAMSVAFVVTALIACAMLAIGASALFNPNNVAASNAPIAVSAQPVSVSSDVQQYQKREKQYQSQLDEANAQIQSYQSVMSELQQRGLIRILSDGTIQLRGR